MVKAPTVFRKTGSPRLWETSQVLQVQRAQRLRRAEAGELGADEDSRSWASGRGITRGGGKGASSPRRAREVPRRDSRSCAGRQPPPPRECEQIALTCSRRAAQPGSRRKQAAAAGGRRAAWRPRLRAWCAGPPELRAAASIAGTCARPGAACPTQVRPPSPPPQIRQSLSGVGGGRIASACSVLHAGQVPPYKGALFDRSGDAESAVEPAPRPGSG